MDDGQLWLASFRDYPISGWTAAASFNLLVRDYEAIISTFFYVSLLSCWYIYISNDHLAFNEIMPELMRSITGYDKQWSYWGTHWTLNIAEIILSTIFSSCFEYLFPNHYWTHVTLLTVFRLLVLGHHLTHLWLQKQITRLARWNKNMWKWKDLCIDMGSLYLLNCLDYPAARAIVKVFWWTCYQICRILTPEVLSLIDRSLPSLLFLSLMNWFVIGTSIRPICHAIHMMITYKFWLRELGPFANPNPPEYQYIPLQDPEHIRVILLYPRFGFGPICCRLLQGPHMRLLFYEAISYNWGSMEVTEEILVDGCTRKVTQSVYEILASYSSHLLPRLLWIDALCIDQENNEEKSQQVPLMEKIYSNAILTTIFLGQSPLTGKKKRASHNSFPYRYDSIRPHDKESEAHFEVARLSFDLLNEFRVLEKALRLDLSIYQLFEMVQPRGSTSGHWKALLKMLQHPWFTRIWVVQEVALSHKVKVRYGDEVLDWQVLVNGVNTVHGSRSFLLWLEWVHGVQLRQIEHTSLYNIIRMNEFRNKMQNGRSWCVFSDSGVERNTNLPQLLAETFYFTATNPRDLIYGVMSLCPKPLKVDYRVSVEDVYLSTAHELIRANAFHVLLHAAGLGNRNETTPMNSKLPTWVPDWTIAPQYKRLPKRGWNQKEARARLREKPIIRLETERTLSLSGYFIDSIQECCPVLFNSFRVGYDDAETETRRLAANYAQCWRAIEESSYTEDPYPHSKPQQSLREAFRKTLLPTGARSSWNRSIDETSEAISKWETNLETFGGESLSSSVMDKKAIYDRLESMEEMTQTIKSFCGGRRMFLSTKGYIGLAPPYSLPGDFIYFVPGLHVPILVRREISAQSPQSQSSSMYQYVGECCTHGLTAMELSTMDASEQAIGII